MKCHYVEAPRLELTLCSRRVHEFMPVIFGSRARWAAYIGEHCAHCQNILKRRDAGTAKREAQRELWGDTK